MKLSILPQVSNAFKFLSGLFFWSNAEEGTAADEQGPDIDARLPELWFGDIPHCTVCNSSILNI